MADRFVSTVARGLLGLFYRRVEVAGLERVPARGPLLLVANHHNALIDPMLLLATIPRRLVSVAKAPLFRHPLIGPFLRLAGAIPVHRRQDLATDAAGADPARNAEMFSRAIGALRDGDAILIFPEGVSQPEPVVMPLRTGAARIVLGAEGAADGRLGVTVLPVGLVYHEPGTFRTGWALVLVGDPVPTADLVASASEEGVRQLTDRIAAALRRLVVEARDRETLHLLHVAEAIWREEVGERTREVAVRADWTQRALRAHAYLATQAPERVDDLRRDLERYAKDLELAGLTGRQLARSYPAGVVVRYALREGLSLLLGLPLALWGIVNHAIPYQLTSLAVRTLRPEADTEATYKISTAVMLYPLCWAAEGWLAWQLGQAARLGGAWLLVVFVASLGPTGFFALTWQERLSRVRREARGFMRFLTDRDLHHRLLGQRQALVEELTALARSIPDSVLSEEPPR